ncbi:MAG: glycosyltransferase [Selenomonadaceae bacterium]|nr:glycosyltransferase [Selenomonadaceae bacterium]
MVTPAVSVIIPMYNAEKYIGECLDSLLKQTFQDFEIIVVDDCSTDNSVAIAENILEKFGRENVLIKRKKNSGNFGYTARNRGFRYAKGEYVFFVDADDMLTDNALEELYASAKRFAADVVYTGARYLYTAAAGAELKLDKEGRKWQKKEISEVQKLTVNEPHKLLENLLITAGVFWTPWTKFVRRQFLLDNNITFYEIISGGDYIWTLELFCCAKRFVRMPQAFYLWRSDSETSVSRTTRTPEIQINTWNEAFVHSTRALADLLNKRSILRNNPAYCYFAQKNFFEWCFGRNLDARGKFKPEELYEIFGRELGNADDFDAMTKFFFSFIDSQQKEIKSLKAKKEPTGVPKISVVVPLYNMERFVGECLDSLLKQTFQDFEVIVVDDCSIDNSMKIVKSYEPKFKGRLRYTSTKVNSGGGGYIPRNIGFGLSRGEYVFFADSDDFLLLTGLETLYKAAEEFNADVTYIASYYRLDRPNELRVFRDSIGKDLLAEKREDKPILTVSDPKKVVYEYLHKKCHHAPWAVFVKRSFLIENRISFPEEIYNGGDGIWNIHIRALAKRFLRLPSPVYFRRCYDLESITRKKRSPAEQMAHRARAFSLWINTLHKLSNQLQVLKENPVYAYDAFKVEIGWILNDLREYRKKLKNREIYEIIYSEIVKDSNSPDWLMPFFFAFVDDQEKDISKFKSRAAELEKKSKK